MPQVIKQSVIGNNIVATLAKNISHFKKCQNCGCLIKCFLWANNLEKGLSFPSTEKNSSLF